MTAARFLPVDPTVGILQFVPEADRRARIEARREVGVAAVVETWADVEQLLR